MRESYEVTGIPGGERDRELRLRTRIFLRIFSIEFIKLLHIRTITWPNTWQNMTFEQLTFHILRISILLKVLEFYPKRFKKNITTSIDIDIDIRNDKNKD